ncbi:hypothetical protein [Phytohabitans suffuscus]|uniref:Uncharacterized protein n=1 Tax=Phytohabitans suffuscus TaxID=624315 RepID=A0A6F8YLR8_9ACTN|nr:hypothetical protein [Phytohabitans suffuscus]BCB87062.1 hypothetical protein Psuf_043750 [Phytohabitans suffuscus]
MSDEYVDPSGNTEAFRSFAQGPEAEAPPSRLPLIIGIAVLAVILVALVAFLALG